MKLGWLLYLCVERSDSVVPVVTRIKWLHGEGSARFGCIYVLLSLSFLGLCSRVPCAIETTLVSTALVCLERRYRDSIVTLLCREFMKQTSVRFPSCSCDRA